MRFAHPAILFLLAVVPVYLAYVAFFRLGDLPRFRFSQANKDRGFHFFGRKNTSLWAPALLRAATMTLLILGLARPQKGIKTEEMTTKATDIMICLDASRSMLSIDFKPDDRFTVAKNVVSEFIKGRPNDRLGLVLFAEYAVTQCPLTSDRDALLQIMDTLQVGAIPPDQTAVGVGLATSVNRLKGSQAKSKVIILVTDGANNAGTIDPVTAARTAASFGIKIYSIGAGSPEGGLVPIDDPRLGRRMVPIPTELDEDTLLKVAGLTNGKYFRAKDSDGLKTIFKEIDTLEKTDIKVREFVDWEEWFPWFLLAALVCGFVEIILQKTVLRTLP